MDFHARAVIEHPDGELAAVSNWRPESLAAFAERHGVARTTLDWRELADDPEIGAIVIGTPNALHAPQAIACLEQGKHVLVEKPMARTLEEAQRMNAAAEASGATLMVAHCWRFHDDVRALRRRVADGELGDVVRTHGYGMHAGWGPDGWFTDRELAGVGALLDMGVHAIDTARFVLGDPLPGRVCASIGTRYGDYEVDDDGLVLISWEGGATSLVESGWWQPHRGGMEAETEVYGTRGYARVWQFSDEPEGYEHCAQPMYSAQMAEFLGALREGRRPRPSGDDGAVIMEIVEQAYRSAGIR